MAIHLIITSNNRTWVLSIIYNSYILSEQKLLWHSLHGFSLLNTPWLLTWDFNAITNSEEHRGELLIIMPLNPLTSTNLSLIPLSLILGFQVPSLLGATTILLLLVIGQDSTISWTTLCGFAIIRGFLISS